MNLTQLFDNSLVRRQERPALEYADTSGQVQSLRFSEVEARANRMARVLVAMGARAGDRLCVYLPNCIEVIDVFLACTRLGVIYVPVNPAYRERELRHIIADAAPRAVITSRETGVTFTGETNVWTIEELSANALRQLAIRLSINISRNDPAAIVYTSGTTGQSKGAVLSHSALVTNARSIVDAWRITENDRYLAVLPLFHVHGLANGIHAWLASGCHMRLETRFDYREAATLFSTYRPTLFFGVPTIYVRLIDDSVISGAQAKEIGNAARLFVSGSAPLPSHILEAFARKFGHTILERYGMSEALMITTNPYDGERRPGSVGHPFPGIEIRLADEAGAEVADGDVGEVVLRSPHLFSGYWNNEPATTAAFVDGFFRSGDLGTRSADGYLTLRGRRGDMIISGGFNVYPREIEEFLLEDPRIREVAVTGAADAVRGEVPVAYVVTDSELDPAELEALCREHLASYKVPRKFLRIDSLPRTPLGKVQKHLLPPG